MAGSRPRIVSAVFAAAGLLATSLTVVWMSPAAWGGEASAFTYASTSASAAPVSYESSGKGGLDLALPADAIASAGGASAFASAVASAGSSNSIVGPLAPHLGVKAYGKAGGDQNTVSGVGRAGASWSDYLRYGTVLTPPEGFLKLHAVFHCHLDGSLTGPAGAADVSYAIEVDRTDYNGNPVHYRYARSRSSPLSIDRTVELGVPVEAFIPGRGAGGQTIYPGMTMNIEVNAQSVYEPSETSKWVGNGQATFDSTFALDTIYFADEHGNPVSGFENFQIVGDNGPYVMGPPPGGFLQEIVVLDRFGRRLNERGLTLVDWEGQIANPAIRIQVVPPSDATFPATATISCPEARVYFDEPSTADDSGPTKTLSFPDRTPVPLLVSIFPDRDGVDEDWPITVEFKSSNGASRTLIVNAHVIDQDQPTRPVEFPVTVDFSRDQTGFFADGDRRALYEQLANDWAYFFANPGLEPVPAGAEKTFIWNPTGFLDGTFITNSNAYRGYLLYAYGIDQATPPFRSGGEPSSAGGFLTAGGASLNLRRSGGQELEVKGNYNTLGWYVSTGDSDWWKATNLGDVQNDLASIPHHEMGHAFIFNPSQPAFAHFKSLGSVQDARVLAYQGVSPAIDASDHLASSVDRLSGRGAFGNEYYGSVPARRWLITKLDLLVAQAIGYSLRNTSPFLPAQIATTALPRGGAGGPYAQTLQARGGVPFYRWSVSSGSLPPGLALDSFTGALTGVPSAVGDYAFRVRLEDYDAAAAAVEADFTLRIEATPFEITSVRASPTVQVSYRTGASHTYRVDYSEDLQVWTTLAPAVPGTGGVVTTSDPAGASRPRRFYRITEM